MPQEPELLNIVILGASFAGLSVAHHFLDRTLESLRSNKTAQVYRVVLISPSTHIYWNIGAPRALVATGLLKDEDTFVPIEPGFSRHKPEDWVFIQGLCTSWNHESRTVTIETIGARAQKRCEQVVGDLVSATPRTPKTLSSSYVSSAQQTIPYHALILATGTSADSDLLSLHGPHGQTIASLEAFHRQLPNATSVTVCGGGPSGVETAGQLATYMNHLTRVPSFLTGRQQRNPSVFTGTPHKTITLITGAATLLPKLKPAVGRNAEKQLRRLGVTIIKNVRVLEAESIGSKWTSATTTVTPAINDQNLLAQPSSTKDSARVTSSGIGKDKIVLTLDNNTTHFTDLYVAATGVRPNSSYAPPKFLTSDKYISTDPFQRVPGAGDRVYAIGDVASTSENYVLDIYGAVDPLMRNLYNDLRAFELRRANQYGGNEDEVSALVDLETERKELNSQLCPISRHGGAGVVLGLTLPSFMVFMLKGHDYRVGKGRKVVVDGNCPYPE